MRITLLSALLAGTALAACSSGGGSSSTTQTGNPAPTPAPAPATDTYTGDSGTVSTVTFPERACLNVGNALEADPTEGNWGVTIEESYFDTIADAGFEMVRIPVRWHNKTGAAPDYTIEPSWMNRVEQVVDQALARDLSVILNVHHYDPLYADPDAEEARFLKIWEQIAERFQDKPQTLYFEVINEPRERLSGERLGRLNHAVVPVIRATNPDRVLILSGDQWGGVDGLIDSFSAPDDDRIAASFHTYDPFGFTHQGATFLADPPPVGTSWGTAQDKAELRARFQAADEWSDARGVPLFMGEGGVYQPTTVPAERLEWYKTAREASEEFGMPGCWWNFLSDFRTYDETSGQWVPGMLEALGLEE